MSWFMILCLCVVSCFDFHALLCPFCVLLCSSLFSLPSRLHVCLSVSIVSPGFSPLCYPDVPPNLFLVSSLVSVFKQGKMELEIWLQFLLEPEKDLFNWPTLRDDLDLVKLFLRG